MSHVTGVVSVGERDALASRVKAQPALSLRAVHEQPEERLLRFTGVIAAEDRRDAVFRMNADLRIGCRIGQLYRDELRRLAVGRLKELRPRERDPSVFGREVQPAHVRSLRVPTDDPVDADDVIVRIVDPLDPAIEHVVIRVAEVVVDGVRRRVGTPRPILAHVRR